MSSLSRLLYRAFSTALPSTPEPNPNTIKALSNDLFKERNLKRLVEKFKKSSEIERFRCRPGIYKETVHRLATAKKFDWIEEILEDQKKYKDISKEGFVVRLISLYGKSGMFDHAHKMFDEMPDLKCKRTVLSFNALLKACVDSKKFDKVDGFFRELPEKLSIEPDVVSHNVLIKAFCTMGSYDSAISILDDMEKKGLEPDLITFNTLLDGLYGNNRFLDGEKIWALMEKKDIVPDIRSYNSKLLGLVLEKKLSEAVELFKGMGTEGFRGDVFSYNALIKGFCEEGNLEEAKKRYSDLLRIELTPNVTTFATLIPFLCEKGEFDLAFNLCKKIFKRRHLVDVSVLQLAVDALVKATKVEDAEKLVEMGKSNSYFRYALKLPADK